MAPATETAMHAKKPPMPDSREPSAATIKAANSNAASASKAKWSVVASKSVEEAHLLIRKPAVFRNDVLPFLLVYVSIASLFVWMLGVSWICAHWEVVLGVYVATAVVHAVCFLSTFWSVRFWKWCCFAHVPIERLDAAHFIYLRAPTHKGRSAIVPIERQESPLGAILHFTFQQDRFFWNAERRVFCRPSLPVGHEAAWYRATADESSPGLSSAEVAAKTELHGANRFSIPQPSFMELFKEHAIAPFFLFQVFCVMLWMMDDYWYYSMFTLFMLVVFECTVVGQRIANVKEFKTMTIAAYTVDCRRDGAWIATSTENLVPGDVVRLRIDAAAAATDVIVPCDMVLVTGTCVVNEAMLSGESTPLQKESIAGRADGDAIGVFEDRLHVLYGGTRVLQTTPASGSEAVLCVVVRTGFQTTQGRLIKTMLFNTETVSANNAESFAFIAFLLVFALAAAWYVWREGCRDAARSRFKLAVECVLIVTQVVPPELPMELSLAVNASLMALGQFAIFCTEPFRIPFAGKVDVCCLDKTGTITDDSLVLNGAVGLCAAADPHALVEVADAPAEFVTVIAACHSLMLLEVPASVDGKLPSTSKPVGDPMEIATLDATPWRLVQTDMLMHATQKMALKTLKKFAFCSALKRMSVVSSIVNATGSNNSSKERCIVTVKGAPEVLKDMCRSVPSWYAAVFKSYARQGGRVIAFGTKTIPVPLTPSKLAAYSRENAECDLEFAGFLVFYCPLKKDSVMCVQSLVDSSHKVVMITGDNALTAIHVAEAVGIAASEASCAVVDASRNGASFDVCDVAETFHKEVRPDALVHELAAIEDLCITGAAYELLVRHELLSAVLRKICVFARASPMQKETIMVAYKQQSLITLMCGDGTNDVGALKQSHIGIALLDGKPEDLEKIKKRARLEAIKKQQQTLVETQKRLSRKFGLSSAANGGEGEDPAAAAAPSAMEQRLSALTKALDDDVLPAIKLGDASVAAPFTSKLSTLDAVCNIIKQGRCTLVTTIQMYKILALNSLISAYSLSVLHLDGVRYGDSQSTIMGFLITFCFLFLSKGKPLKTLSPKRPQSNIFNAYIMSSILAQFGVHLACLMSICRVAKRFVPERVVQTTFEPGLINSVIYLMTLSMQVCTFMINYQGHPFRESLFENTNLRNSLFAVAGLGFALALESFPDVNAYMQIVPLPPAVKHSLVGAMAADYALCAAVEWLAYALFANEDPKPFCRRGQQRSATSLQQKKNQ